MAEAEQEPEAQPPARAAAHQVYFITVDWLDEPHQPESPERLAQVLRQAIVHAHDHGPQMPPSRFTIRVKSGDLAAELAGIVQHHHHQPPPGPPPEPPPAPES